MGRHSKLKRQRKAELLKQPQEMISEIDSVEKVIAYLQAVGFSWESGKGVSAKSTMDLIRYGQQHPDEKGILSFLIKTTQDPGWFETEDELASALELICPVIVSKTASDSTYSSGEVDIIKKAGQILWQAGGIGAMLLVLQNCIPSRVRKEVEIMWDGIGEWRC